MAGIDTTSPHYKGKYASIYEVNVDFPNGGSAGDYVDILGFAHYWNPDRNNWCVNEERDEYWDELLASAAEGVKRLETGLAEETSERANADAELSQAINIVNKATQENSKKISDETAERTAADAELWGGIQNEADIRTAKDAELTQAIVDETSNRERTMEAMARNIQATIDEEKHWREQGDTNTNTRIDGSNDVIIEHNKILYPLVLHIYGLDDLYEKGTTPMVKLYWIASRAGQQVNARIYIKKSTEESYYEVPENSTYYETYITDDTVFYIRAEYDYELLGESVTIVTEKTLKADFVGVMRFGFNQSDSIDESGINTLAAQPFSTTPFGDYTLTTLTYGYMWLCVPTDMPYITKVTMNGFEVPMARPVIVGDYRCYRSRAQLVSGTYNITLS